MAEALIRYNLYIDCMPTDGVAQLDSEQINRIVSRALNTLSLKRNEFDTNQLLAEVNTGTYMFKIEKRRSVHREWSTVVIVIVIFII